MEIIECHLIKLPFWTNYSTYKQVLLLPATGRMIISCDPTQGVACNYAGEVVPPGGDLEDRLLPPNICTSIHTLNSTSSEGVGA
jgi:hypothetical protein